MTTREYDPKKGVFKITFLILFIFLGVLHFTTPYMACATLAYSLMVTGLIFRKETRIHFKIMGLAIFLDLSIVLVLEIKRHAIHTALSFTLSPLQQCHIAMSSVAAVLYLPILVLGFIRLVGRGTRSMRSAHITLGISAFIFRTLGFFLMFSMLGMHLRD